MTKSAICIVLFSVFTTFFATAQHDTIIDNKSYIVHTISANETLFTISRKYNIELNKLWEDKIRQEKRRGKMRRYDEVR